MDPFYPHHELPHEPPPWVQKSEYQYFLTICCKERFQNSLCFPEVAEKLIASIRYYHKQKRWYPYFVLLMPDHIHGVFCFPDERQIKISVSSWKHYISTSLKIRFQKDFFEHRVRSEPQRKLKLDYVCNNPVRAGFVHDPKQWPYIYRGYQLLWNTNEEE